MSLGEHFNNYPKVKPPSDVHDGRDLTDPQILHVEEGAMYELEIIDLSMIEMDPNSPEDYVRSGSEWDGNRRRSFKELETKIENKDDIPPLVLKKLDNGKYKVMDGYHRSSIARHLGLTQFPAYVIDEKLIISREVEALKIQAQAIDQTTDFSKLHDILLSGHPLLDDIDMEDVSDLEI